MEDPFASYLHSRCCCCLSKNEETRLQTYHVQNNTLRTALRMEHLMLCYICKRVAENTDRFIKNIENNLPLFEDYKNKSDWLFHFKSFIKPIYDLTSVLLDPQDFIELSDSDNGYERHLLETEINVEVEEVDEKYVIEPEDEASIETAERIDEYTTKTRRVRKKASKTNNRTKTKQKTASKQKTDTKSKLKNKVNEKEDTSNIQEEKDSDIGTEVNTDDGFIVMAKEISLSHDDDNVDDDDDDFEYPLQGNDFVVEEPKPEVLHYTEEQCIAERATRCQDKHYLASSYKCVKCIKWFTSQWLFDKHMKTHSESNGKFECTICSQRFESDRVLATHRNMIHFQRYKCNKCDFVRSTRNAIKNHFFQKHCNGHLGYSCSYCGVKYRAKRSLYNHVKSKHERQLLPCPICKKTYTLKQSLTVHMIAKHPEAMGAQSGKQYECAKCGRGFASSAGLSNHRRTHIATREHLCVECNKYFKTEAALKVHFNTTNVHSSANFICDYCGTRLPSKMRLVGHIHEHFGTKPHPCNLCDKGFNDERSLKRHILYVHKGFKPPRNMPCKICDKVFNRKSILANHMRIHTGQRPFKCDKCPAEFRSSGTLYNHNKLVHLCRLNRKKT